MQVNNETGVVQDPAVIGRLTRERGVLLHVDAAQSAGKLPIDLATMPVDLMSFSAHKVYGPKGIGALYVRRLPKVRLMAQQHGGGQEHGLRAGTLATHQIVGMGAAFAIAQAEMTDEITCVLALRERLWQGIRAMDAVYLNGDPQQRVAGILNVSFGGVDGEALRAAIRDIAVSSGSACTSAVAEPSHVLLALGRSKTLARSALRFSLGRFTTLDEIDYAIARVQAAVTRLRELSPVWERYLKGMGSAWEQ
jgi:cysteine desulfurase